MIENSSQIIINNIEPISYKLEGIRFFGTIIATFIAVYGSFKIFRKKEEENRKNEHFKKIKNEILGTWLINIDQDPNSINKSLFEDLVNHFPKLIQIYEEFKKLKEEEENIINEMLKKYKNQYANLKIYPHFRYYFLNSNIDSFKPRIENNELRGCDFTYAECDSNKKFLSVLEKFKHKLEQDLKNENTIKVIDLNKLIDLKKKQLKEDIEKIQNKEKLDGNCTFLN